MTTTETPASPFGDIVFESIPDAPARPPGKGREPVAWESHLANVEDQLLEKPARLWAYENKTGAVSRMSAVRSRLAEAAPAQNWEFKVRPVPNTEPQLHGVYAVFHGEHSPEAQLKNAQERQVRRDRVIKASAVRAAAKAAESATEAPVAPVEELAQAPAQTPKERLAASRK
jgi:hypothetical protein